MGEFTIEELNWILADCNIPYQAIKRFPVSGQRKVYEAEGLLDKKTYVIKAAQYTPYTVGRIQREIGILNKLKSEYFPTIIFDTFISKEILDHYYDNLKTKNNNDTIPDFKTNIRPFYLTIEECIEHVSWETFMQKATLKEFLNLLRQCFEAIELLWSNKIVHRDLKPDNILIKPNGSPVVIDLGIAKSFNDGTLNLTPDFAKNPHTILFASPEQLRDEKEAITYKTDQYSMGVIAYNQISGLLPFGNIEEIGPESYLENMIHFRYTPMPIDAALYNEELEKFIKKLLSPYPHKRFRKSSRIFKDLDAIEGTL